MSRGKHMARIRRKTGPERRERGKGITAAELDQIALLKQAGVNPREIAKVTGRGLATIYKVIAEGRLDQKPIDFGGQHGGQ